MALGKSLDTDFQVPADYHRITRLAFVYGGGLSITVSGYKDAAAADHVAEHGGPALIHTVVTLDPDAHASEIAQVRAMLYAAIKRIAPFTTAEDV